jgi:hypothetical protein
MKHKIKEVKLQNGKAPDCPICGYKTHFSYFGGRCDIVCPTHGVVGDLPTPYSDVARLKVRK